jgi:hypothetical protein
MDGMNARVSTDDGPDAGEGVRHHWNDGAITQTHDG